MCHLSNYMIHFFSLPDANQEHFENGWKLRDIWGIKEILGMFWRFRLKCILPPTCNSKTWKERQHTHEINERPLCTPLKLLQFLWYIPSQIPVRFLWRNAHKRILQKDNVLDGYFGELYSILHKQYIDFIPLFQYYQ